MLTDIITAPAPPPPRLVVYGSEGVGKSSFAASAPRPIFIPTEDGLGRIDCHRFPVVTSYADFVTRLGQVVSEEHDYQTLVVDTADWLEKLIWAEVARKQSKPSIEDIGYGKGYVFALDQWKEVIGGLDAANARGMAVVVLAHSKIEKFNDPEGPSYDRYTLRLHREADAYLREWADAVLFATRRVRVEKEDLGFNKTRAIAKGIGADGGDRMLRTVPSPACTAKNRFGITGDIPLSWNALAEYL